MSDNPNMTSGAPGEAAEFLMQWAAATGSEVISLSAIDPVTGKIHSRGFAPTDTGGVRGFVGQYSGNWNLYFGPNSPDRPSEKRLAEKDIVKVHCIHVDIDPRDGMPHREERDAILTRLENFVPPPTVITDSGGGFQAFWLLKVAIADPAGRSRARAINAGIAKRLGGDKCHSLEHLMRLPGTINVPNKAKQAKGRARALARVVRFSESRFDIGALDQFLVDNTSSAEVHISIDTLARVDLTAVSLPASLAELIRTGGIAKDPDRFASRSEAIYYALCGLVKAGLSNDHVISILTDEAYAISEKPLERKRAVEWLVPQLTKVRQRIAAATQTYRATQNGIVMMVDKKGENVPVALTNFNASIVAEHIRDDGSNDILRTFVIEGELFNGKTLSTIEVPAADFEQMRWLTEKWGVAPTMIPQRMHRDHTASAIRALSTATCETRVYLHTGWKKVGSQYIYLHADGGIGRDGIVPGVCVDLPEGMKDFVLEEPIDAVAEARASLEIAALGRGTIGYSLLASIYRSVLCEFLPATFSVFLEGGSGSFKSTVSALAQGHFGRNWATSRLPANWASTENALERQAFLAKDALLVVDDFTPSGNQHSVSRLHAAAERLLRGQGNQSGRQRLKADSSFRSSFSPRGLIMSSGEDVPEGKSLGARLLIIRVEPGDIDREMLSRLQNFCAEGVFARATGGFVRWISSQASTLRPTLRDRFGELRGATTGGHNRTPENAANAILGVEQFVRYAQNIGAITEDEASTHLRNARDVISGLSREQTAHIQSEDQATRYIDYLGAALRMGRAHLVESAGERQPEHAPVLGWIEGDHGLRPGGDRIGWVDGGSAFIDQRAALSVVQRIARESSDHISFRQKALNRELRNAGFIKSADAGRNLLLKTLGGRRLTVLHLELADLIGASEGLPGSGQEPVVTLGRRTANIVGQA